MNKDVAEISQTYQVEAAEQGVPAGYKQTEVGVTNSSGANLNATSGGPQAGGMDSRRIPEGWVVYSLGELLKEPPKYGINAAAVALTRLLPVYIRITDISEDGYFKPAEKVGVDSPFSDLYQLAEGDILLARTGASVGKSYLYNKSDGELVYAGFLIKVSPNKTKLDPRYLSQYLKTEKYWNWVVVNSMRSGQPGINGQEYASLPIACPPIDEQTAIANALSDVDALLGELEKLIAKKQAIKTATMQQLLTGRTRLPQFAQHQDGSPKGYKQSELGEIPEDWDSINLGVCAEVCMCKRIFSNQTLDVGFIPFYKIGTFGKEADAYISKEIYAEYRAKYSFPKKGDVLISAAGTLGRTVIYDGEPAYFQDSNIVWLDINKSKLSNIYLYHYYQVIKWASTEGSTIARLYNGIIKASLITLPSIEEQTAIATILSDMDAELQALEQRLNKTRQIKQGMMQQLLTGKIRLAKPTHKESEYD